MLVVVGVQLLASCSHTQRREFCPLVGDHERILITWLTRTLTHLVEIAPAIFISRAKARVRQQKYRRQSSSATASYFYSAGLEEDRGRVEQRTQRLSEGLSVCGRRGCRCNRWKERGAWPLRNPSAVWAAVYGGRGVRSAIFGAGGFCRRRRERSRTDAPRIALATVVSI